MVYIQGSPQGDNKNHNVIKNPEILASDYAGWKTFTLPNEKASFKYPAGWKLQNDNASAGQSSPESDAYELKAPNGFDLAIEAEKADGALGGGNLYLDKSVPIEFVKKKYYLDYFGLYRTNVTQAFLSASADNINPAPIAQNNIAGKGNTTSFYINFETANASSGVGMPVSQIMNDTYFRDATLIIESVSY